MWLGVSSRNVPNTSRCRQHNSEYRKDGVPGSCRQKPRSVIPICDDDDGATSAAAAAAAGTTSTTTARCYKLVLRRVKSTLSQAGGGVRGGVGANRPKEEAVAVRRGAAGLCLCATIRRRRRCRSFPLVIHECIRPLA